MSTYRLLSQTELHDERHKCGEEAVAKVVFYAIGTPQVGYACREHADRELLNRRVRTRSIESVEGQGLACSVALRRSMHMEVHDGP